MRLGSYKCKLVAGTLTQKNYGADVIRERHRHRFEFNNQYMEQFEEAGFRVAGVNPKRNLVEIMEITDHTWFVGVQFHPEFQSKPRQAHPLFEGFVAAALERRNQR